MFISPHMAVNGRMCQLLGSRRVLTLLPREDAPTLLGSRRVLTLLPR
jgi:hypothetical protein